MNASSKVITGCDVCNKSGLSLLLLRPSPIAKETALAPPGAENVQVDENGLVSGLVPAEALTESRYGLRLLRPGYVHVYLPNPPKGVASWLIYRVTENADLVEHRNPVFAQSPQPAPCSRDGHNANGMRLLPIPQAHLIDTIWIAYSANLWGDTLKQQNAANPAAMQEINLKTGPALNPGTFRPSSVELKAKVLECALRQLSVNKSIAHDFPFVSLASNVEDLASELTKAAARHPATEGKELAVVLRDPAGVAAELNGLRLRRYELADQYMLQPHIQWPLEINKIVLTLKKNLIAEATEASIDAVTPLRHKSTWDTRPLAGAQWEQLTDEEAATLQKNATSDSAFVNAALWPYRNAFSREPLGRVIYPDHEQRARKWAEENAGQTWDSIKDYIDEEKRTSWLAQFESDMQRLHMDALRRYELDWGKALGSALVDYFTIHFDPEERNTRTEMARTGCSSGAVYLQDAALCFSPEGMTDAVQKIFEEQLDADIAQPNAIMLRAMAGNQKSLIDILVDDKNDKTYDFIKGLIGEYTGAVQAAGKPLSPRMNKLVSWLTHVNLGFSLGLAGALAAVAVPQPKQASGASNSTLMQQRASRAQGMALIHQASEQALKSALGNMTVSVPVVVMANCSPAEARQIMMSRGEPLNRRTVRAMGKGQVTLAMVIDSDTLRQLKAEAGQLKGAIGKSAQTVALNEQAFNYKSLAVSSAGATALLPLPKLSQIYLAHQAKVSRISGLAKVWMQTVQAGPAATRNTWLSLDGRLAMGSMIVQGLGAYRGLVAYNKAKTAEEKTDAMLSMADGGVGFLGGMAELSAVWWYHRTEVAMGRTAANASISTATLRGVGNLLGFVGNLINAWMSWRDANKLEKAGRSDLAIHMRISGVVFMLGGVPLAIVAADYFLAVAVRAGLISASNLVVRSVSRAAAARICAGIGARLGVAAAGLSVPGAGWVLTAIAVGETVYVIVNTHGSLQTWLAGSYFGKVAWYQSNVPKRQSWRQELDAYNTMMGEQATTP